VGDAAGDAGRPPRLTGRTVRHWFVGQSDAAEQGPGTAAAGGEVAPAGVGAAGRQYLFGGVEWRGAHRG
jgi:hypothetical protein